MSKTTPGYLHHTHNVMGGQFTGDEILHVTDHVEVINNYVYIDGINTGVNVKGDPGPQGKSAYQSYVDMCNRAGVEPLTEDEWVKTFDTITYIIGGDGVQSDYAETDETELSYIKNKPLTIVKDETTDTIEISF